MDKYKQTLICSSSAACLLSSVGNWCVKGTLAMVPWRAMVNFDKTQLVLHSLSLPTLYST